MTTSKPRAWFALFMMAIGFYVAGLIYGVRRPAWDDDWTGIQMVISATSWFVAAWLLDL